MFEIVFGQNNIIVVNLYSPPARARSTQQKELQRILNAIAKDYPSHKLIISGDFNFPSISWNDVSGLPEDFNLNPIERRFSNHIQNLNLRQFNFIPNSRGVILDLLLSNTQIMNLHKTDDFRLMDANSAHHFAISFGISIEFTEDHVTRPDTILYDYSTTKLNHAHCTV